MANAFRLDILENNIALLTFDVPDKKVNALSNAILDELSDVVGDLEGRDDLRGLILRSGKPGQFIAGADLNELAVLADATPEQIAQGVVVGHELFGRVSRLPFPTVALIEGHCLGGGTEFVLSMDYRLISNGSKSAIALPEVTIGVIPGWGGTQRLPRLIGLHHAIKMITSGETISSHRAVALGLVFDVVPGEQMIDEATRIIERSRQSGEWKRNRETMRQPLGLTDDQAAFAFSVAEGYIRGKTGRHYPAPLIALKAIRDGINLPLDEGLAVEQRASIEVMQSTTAANLIGVFFKGNRVERNSGIDLRRVTAADVGRVGVLGAGLMGAGIAAAHARRGIHAALVDVDNERVDAGLKAASHVVESRIQIGRATPEDLGQMLSLLSTSTSRSIFADCDVVVEAVPENEQLKTKIYGELAAVMRDDAILASNTSTISISRMAKSAPAADRFVGMHFFSPVDRMKLVEVVRGDETSDETVATIVKLAQRIGKTPIVVRDCPGFLVNRILMPYMSEAVLLLTEGASMDDIDKAATRFGMPVGPIALHDMVGLDVACFAGGVLAAAYSDRVVGSDLLKKLVAAGRLGKKSGKGFRQFVGRKRKPASDPDVAPIIEGCRTDDREFTSAEITDRLFLTMLLEAARVLEEEIVSEPAHVDMGLILGTGFPPFRGGLLGWCDDEGAATLIERSAKYSTLGKRFEPNKLLKQMATSGERFYPRANSATGLGGS